LKGRVLVVETGWLVKISWACWLGRFWLVGSVDSGSLAWSILARWLGRFWLGLEAQTMVIDRQDQLNVMLE
jgi:hypothetical protein